MFKKLFSQQHRPRRRRLGTERRYFFYSLCIPERRSCEDRRSGVDRRRGLRSPTLKAARPLAV